MMPEKPVKFTRAIARFVAETRGEEIPKEIYEYAKVAFMDWLAVTMGGNQDVLVKKLIHYSDLMGGNEQATVLGHNIKRSVSQATLINGAASHALDYDDTLKAFLGHPSVTLFPALLAISEWKENTGTDFLTAYIIGLKAGAAIGASAGLDHYMAGWHGTSTVGHLASAAGCARLMRLDEKQTINALGIAGTQACGLKRVFGTMCKPFHAGRASHAGLLAAILASDDFTSAEDILEGPQGFFQVLRGQVNDNVLETLGKTWDIENIAQKYHASCHATHSPIEAVLHLVKEEDLSSGDIRSITIQVSQLSLDAAGNLRPKTALEGKFSIPYCVANAVMRNNTGIQAFTDDKVNDPEIQAFMKKVTVILDESLTMLEAKINLETASGEKHYEFHDILENIPNLETKRNKIEGKFQDLCGPVMGDGKSAKLGYEILALENTDNMKNFVENLI